MVCDTLHYVTVVLFSSPRLVGFWSFGLLVFLFFCIFVVLSFCLLVFSTVRLFVFPSSRVFLSFCLFVFLFLRLLISFSPHFFLFFASWNLDSTFQFIFQLPSFIFYIDSASTTIFTIFTTSDPTRVSTSCTRS